jgi:glycosyltransferase involved in cell wall biosynthesis
MPEPNERKLRVAIVHDFLTYWGGAEQVLLSLHHLYPEAPIYTLLYDPAMGKYFPNARIRPSFLSKLPSFLRRRKKLLLPLMATAAESFDLSEFDLVLSSSGSFVKGVIIRPNALHISYCHAPTRFLWDWYYNYLEENHIGPWKRLVLVPVLHLMRMWDLSASERVDYFVANSKNTAAKIKKYYRADSRVIYPPAGFEPASSSPVPLDDKDYFLIVSRLSPYKKIDVAVTALSKMNLPLLIIGEGNDRQRLEKMAAPNIKFLGWQDEAHLRAYYENAKALIFPGEDDFGITMVEAMSCGKPVLALKKGGALEIVKPGQNGEFFESDVPEILADGIRRLSRNLAQYDPQKIKADAARFSRERFEAEMRLFIDEASARQKSDLIETPKYANLNYITTDS